MAAKAAAIPSLTRDSGPPARISTSVPSSGRMRATGGGVRRAGLLERNGIGGEHTFDTVGHVLAGKGRAADVADVMRQLQGIGGALADELRPPFGIAYFITIGLAIVDDLDTGDMAVGVDSDSIGDEFMFADHFI